jgi:hypothetical protein
MDKALQNCKFGAAGEDKINYDIIMNLPNETKFTLLSLFNKSWKDGTTYPFKLDRSYNHTTP